MPHIEVKDCDLSEEQTQEGLTRALNRFPLLLPPVPAPCAGWEEVARICMMGA